MTGIEIALASAALVAAAGSAYVSYQGTQNQAKAGQIASDIKGEQLKSEAATAALGARQQEAERQRKADLTRQQGQAGAAAAGLDYWQSPTVGSYAGEQQRLVDTDISNIQLLGAAGARKYALEGRANDLSRETYSTMGENAWIGPTLSLIGSAAKMGMGFAGDAGAGANTAMGTGAGQAGTPVNWPSLGAGGSGPV